MAAAAFGAGGDIDRAAFVRLTQGGAGIQHRGLSSPKAKGAGHFDGRGDASMAFLA